MAFEIRDNCIVSASLPPFRSLILIFASFAPFYGHANCIRNSGATHSGAVCSMKNLRCRSPNNAALISSDYISVKVINCVNFAKNGCFALQKVCARHLVRSVAAVRFLLRAASSALPLSASVFAPPLAAVSLSLSRYARMRQVVMWHAAMSN